VCQEIHHGSYYSVNLELLMKHLFDFSFSLLPILGEKKENI